MEEETELHPALNSPAAKLLLKFFEKINFDFSNEENRSGIAKATRAVLQGLNKGFTEQKNVSFKELLNEGLKNADKEDSKAQLTTSNQQPKTIQITDGKTNSPGTADSD